MINKASKVYGLTVKIIRREARYGLGVVQRGWLGVARNNDEKRK
jgi:hypothetical protein